MISQVSSTGQRRLDKAVRHVSDLWFPVNSELLMRIQRGLREGIYDLDLDFLLDEVRSDFALYTYCLKETTRRARDAGRPLPLTADPKSLLRSAGLEQLRVILSQDARKISPHSFENSSSDQLARLKEAVVSASCAEVLSPSIKLDPEYGFTTALMRHLGHTLIAWNYPTVYRRVLAQVRAHPESSVDHELSVILGFSPGLLGITLARQWALDPALVAALGGDSERAEIAGSNARVAEGLEKICAVGEALARANDPDRYPTAESDWNAARVELEKSLGFEGMRVIRDRVAENFENYRTLIPHVFPTPIELDPETHLHQHQEQKLVDRNQYLRGCPPLLRKRLKDLYATLTGKEVSRDALKVLVHDLMPLAGFTGGMVYTLDPGTMMLVPRLRFGRIEMRDSNAVPYSDNPLTQDVVALAYRCSKPLLETSREEKGDMCALVSVLGEEEKVGVIYAEVPREAVDRDSMAFQQSFKAIRQTFQDCLGLA